MDTISNLVLEHISPKIQENKIIKGWFVSKIYSAICVFWVICSGIAMGGCAEVLDTLSGGNFDGRSSEFRKQNEQKSVEFSFKLFLI